MQKYRFLDHPADIKLRAFGKDLPELFINAALGMMSFLYDKLDASITTEKYEISVSAESLESLLVNWLAELLWVSDTKHSITTNFQIKNFTPNKIEASIDLIKAKAKDDIKAVTYHELLINKKKNYWLAEVVFDI